MILYVDKSTNSFVSDPLFRSPVDAVSFKRGDAAAIELKFVESGVVSPLASGAEIVFGIKEQNKFDGDFLVHTEYTSMGDSTYLISPSFNTTALNEALNSDGDESNDIASLNAMLEISWSESPGVWQSTNTIVAAIANDVIKGEEGTPLELPSPEDWLAEHSVVYDAAITGLTGGGPTNLDGIPTVDLPLGTLRAVLVGGVYFSIYILRHSTSAESSPVTIRPDDYAAIVNTKVWSLRTFRTSSLYAVSSVACGGLSIEGPHGIGNIQAANLTDEHVIQLPDRPGTLCVVSTYANDAAAASGGLSLGDIYFNGTKFRARTT